MRGFTAIPGVQWSFTAREAAEDGRQIRWGHDLAAAGHAYVRLISPRRFRLGVLSAMTVTYGGHWKAWCSWDGQGMYGCGSG